MSTMNNNDKLAELLFPHVKETEDEILSKYPKRNLPSGACVTRIAPSPTGFLHIGNLYGALIDERLAKQSGGVFYLRIEDTDRKREVEGALDRIINNFRDFGMNFNEGTAPDGETGCYGPYTQSKRMGIYHVFAKKLIGKGLCYPCFCSEEDIDMMREEQMKAGENTGYYGKWAKCRALTFDEVKRRIENGDRYILRLKSGGDENRRISVKDLIKGELSLPENIRDEVVIKSDSLPTYHFAHVVDDYLMGTTHVVRDESYLSTLPVHIEFFQALGWKPPHYMHTAQLLKLDGDSKRKLSKRKDPEFAMDYYKEQGYFGEAVIEYLMMVLNSNFEEWRIKNPRADIDEFEFTIEKMSPSGALFDLNKLLDVSKNTVAYFTAEYVYDKTLEWSAEHDGELYNILNRDKEYAVKILNIGREGNKPRKDIAFMSQIKDYISYFYKELFTPDYSLPETIKKEDFISIITDYKEIYSETDEQTIWFEKIKELAAKNNFAPEMKLYKKNPEAYRGHITDVSNMIRVAVCGRVNTPDMYSVLRILGKAMVTDRIDRAAESV